MGITGRGISFNNIFIRRNQCAPMRPPLARPPMFGGIFSGVSISESFTYKMTFWDALTHIATAFTMTAPLWMSSRSQGATPQGATTNQPKEDKSLSNLVSFYGSKYTINSHPTKPGYYEAVLKGGEGKVIEGDYETLKFLLGKEPDKEKVEGPTRKTTDPEKSTVGKDEPENLEPKEEEQVAPETRITNRNNNSHNLARKTNVPDGWYRTSSKNDGSVVTKNIREGMSARQVTDLILNNKMNYLSPQDRNELAKEIAYNNPSIFKDGKVKNGAHLDKLDLPTIEYIKKKYVEKRTMKTPNGTREAHGTYINKDGTEYTVGQTVKSSTGRYAKQIDGQWVYYAKDGTQLKESHIKNNDPELWNRTHPAPTNSRSPRANRANPHH